MSVDDDFKLAFNATTDELAKGKTGADVVTAKSEPEVPAVTATPVVVDPPTVETPPPEVTAEAPAVVPAAEPPVVAETETTAPDAASVEPTPVETPAPVVVAVAPDKAAEDAKALTEENARLKKELAEKVAVAAPVEEKPAAVKEPEPEPPKPFEYNEDQKKILANLDEEWPDVAAAYKVREEALKHELMTGVQAVMGDFLKKVQEGLAPIVNTHLQLTEKEHFAAIRAAHADYDEVVDQLPEWIEKQPSYLREPMKRVYGEPGKGGGSAQEMIDLVDRFKKETGRAQPEVPSTPSSKPAPAVIKPEATKVAALTVVPAKGTRPKTEQAPPDDYATAFNKTVAELTAVNK